MFDSMFCSHIVQVTRSRYLYELQLLPFYT